MASPTGKDCDALLQKLATMERVIDGLFSSTVGARFIEPKLATLEELASEIPFNEAELRALWNSKVVELWKKYALREGEGDEDGASSPSPVSPCSPNTSRHSSLVQLNTGYQPLVPTSQGALASSSAEAICAEMEQQLTDLPPLKDADLPGVRQLFGLLSKAIVLTARYSSKEHLEVDFFACALPKLSFALAEQFRARKCEHSGKKPLQLLCEVLLDEMDRLEPRDTSTSRGSICIP